MSTITPIKADVLLATDVQTGECSLGSSGGVCSSKETVAKLEKTLKIEANDSKQVIEEAKKI